MAEWTTQFELNNWTKAGLYPNYPDSESGFIAATDMRTGARYGSTYALSWYSGYSMTCSASDKSVYTGKLVVPWGVTGIGDDPDEAHHSGRASFSRSSLKSCIVPPTCKWIGYMAFYDNDNLESVNIENVERFGYWAFYSCSKFDPNGDGVLHIPACCTLIEELAFVYCGKIKSVVFDDPVGWNEDVSDPAVNYSKMIRADNPWWGDLYKTVGG